MTSASTQRPVRTAASPRSTGPSRVRGERQQRIAAMVDGYESSVTLASGLRSVLVVWLALSAVRAVLGVLTFVTDPTTELGETAVRLLASLQLGEGILIFVTLLVSAAWLVPTISNVDNLGERGSPDLWGRITSHVVAGLVAFAALFGIVMLPDLELPLTVLAVLAGFYAQLWVHLSIKSTFEMLWHTSRRPMDASDIDPPQIDRWFAAWLVFSSAIIASEIWSLEGDIQSGVAVAQGVAGGLAAVYGIVLTMSISARQDSRVLAIIENDDDSFFESAPVTTGQIDSAWSSSEGLVSFPDH